MVLLPRHDRYSSEEPIVAGSPGLFRIMALSIYRAGVIRSKHLAMSASKTYTGLVRVARKTAAIASWHERPGRNP